MSKRPSESQRSTAQPSLFDSRPVRRLLCLPMSDLHGLTFTRLLSTLRSNAVLDVRAHPYFDLTGLSRAIAFEMFDRARTPYLHLPLDLRSPTGQDARWRLRRNASDILAALPGGSYPGNSTVMVLVHRPPEIEVLGQAVRHSHGQAANSWKVEQPQFS
jgi:hypothetical protein